MTVHLIVHSFRKLASNALLASSLFLTASSLSYGCGEPGEELSDTEAEEELSDTEAEEELNAEEKGVQTKRYIYDLRLAPLGPSGTPDVHACGGVGPTYENCRYLRVNEPFRLVKRYVDSFQSVRFRSYNLDYRVYNPLCDGRPHGRTFTAPLNGVGWSTEYTCWKLAVDPFECKSVAQKVANLAGTIKKMWNDYKTFKELKARGAGRDQAHTFLACDDLKMIPWSASGEL